MTPLLGATAGYLALVALLAVLAALGVRCGTSVATGIVVAQVLLVVLVLLDVVAYARGRRPADPATHFGYVAVSVLLLPLLTARRRATGARDATDNLVVALACAAAVVVVVRMHATG